MATQPEKYPEWASTLIQELKDVEGDGNLVNIENKMEPTPEWKLSGQLFQQNFPYPYVNYNFDLINKWVVYINEGVIGDYKVMASADTSTTVQNRFGGVWDDLGTDSLAGETIRLFKKTA